MKKQTKIALAVLVLGVAGYYYWKSKQTTTTATTAKFAGNVGPVTKL